MIPLIAANSLSAPLAWHRGMVDVAAFVGTAGALAQALPAQRHIVNLCENRYYFLLAFVAACVREQVTLLPPNASSGTLRELTERYADALVLDDAKIEALLASMRGAAVSELPDWKLPPDRVVALTFTSGSTGTPQAHAKQWCTLTVNAQLAVREVLGGSGAHLVATVPAQHVYGLETTAISALAAGCAVFAGKPFFPSDVRDALAAIDEPRTLVTTPTHLRALLDANIALPKVQRIVSATAPLNEELAERIERAWCAPVHEIYGCTEAGIMAHRRTVSRDPWTTFSGGTMTQRDEAAQYCAPQLPDAIELQDVVESISPTTFFLRGRSADMVKVAGKRTSLAALTQQLLSIEGVRDAAVLVPDTHDAKEARPVAFVVAPALTTQAIMAALSERVDPVFLPRPLLIVAALPRNAVGKLPRTELLQLLAKHRI